MPGQVVERVDLHVSQAEAHDNVRSAEREHDEEGRVHQAEANQSAPNLLDEYGDVEVELFGIKGDLGTLGDKCPFGKQLKDGTMDIDKQNNFVIRVLNQAEVPIKAEHFSYISQKLEDMGQEVKITIKEEPEAQSWLRDDTDKNEEAAKIDNKAPRAKKTKSDLEISEPKIQVKDAGIVVTEIPDPRIVPSVLTQRHEAPESIDETIIETREVKEIDVEEWFDIMAVEYAEYQQHRTAEIGVDPLDAQGVDLCKDRIKDVFPEDTKDVSVRAVQSAELTDVTTSAGGEVEQRNEEARELNASEVCVNIVEDMPSQESSPHDDMQVLEAPALVGALSGEVFDQHPETESTDTSREVSLGVSSLDAAVSREQGEIFTETEQLESAVVHVEIPELLTALFVEIDEKGQDDKTPSNTIEGAEPSHEISVQEDREFIAQIEAYIAQLEAGGVIETRDPGAHVSEISEAEGVEENAEAYLQPRQAFVEVLEIAQRVGQVQTQIEVLLAVGTGHKDTPSSEELTTIQEQKEALEAELYETCEQLLESIGVEPTEVKVRALIGRVLKINFEALEKEHQFTIEQLATMGTHEYKLNDWFQRVRRVFSIADSSLHRTIGTFATRYAAIAD